MTRLQVSVVRSPDEMKLALAVRRRVFIEEQGVPEEIEIDQHDRVVETESRHSVAQHVLAISDGRPVATGRILRQGYDGRLHIGRVAVLAEHRGKGFGRAVMAALHDLARRQGATSVTLAAQLYAIGFYEKLGYKARGEVFLDAGIEHRWMDIEF